MHTPPGFTPLPAPAQDAQAPVNAPVPAPAPAPAQQSSPPWQPVLDEHTRHEMLLAQVDPQAVEKLWDRLEADDISRLTYRSPEVDRLVEYIRLEREKWMSAEAQKGAKRRKKAEGSQQAAPPALTEQDIAEMPF